MKRYCFVIPLILTFLLQACSSENLEQRISSLEERISALESVYGEINDNATALNKLYKENLLILQYDERKENGNVVGYDLKFSDGSTVSITFGKNMEGIAPMIGVDESGKWVVSFDGGETFSEIKGAASPWSADGKSPVVSIDKYGFWQISLDAGKTWQRAESCRCQGRSDQRRGRQVSSSGIVLFLRQGCPQQGNREYGHHAGNR